jgi:malate synthase
MVRAMVPEELSKIRGLLGPAFAEGRYEEASRIVDELIQNDNFVEFLTLPAYERID